MDEEAQLPTKGDLLQSMTKCNLLQSIKGDLLQSVNTLQRIAKGYLLHSMNTLQSMTKKLPIVSNGME